MKAQARIWAAKAAIIEYIIRAFSTLLPFFVFVTRMVGGMEVILFSVIYVFRGTYTYSPVTLSLVSKAGKKAPIMCSKSGNIG